MSTAPSLPLSLVFPVSVVISPTVPAGPLFNQALIIGDSPVIPSSERLRLYTSTTAMISDGFASNDPELLAAQIYFGQTPAPTYLWVGRQDLTAIQTAVLGGSGGTGYVVGDVVTAVQSGASGGKLQVTGIGAGGAVTTFELIQGSQGTGYSVGTNVATTGGLGTGFIINI